QAEPRDRSHKRSRRELLAGAAGALGVLAAESVVRIPAAQATQGQPVIAGQDNTETSATGITNSATNGNGLVVQGGPSGHGVKGYGGSDGFGLLGYGYGSGGGVEGIAFGNADGGIGVGG